MFIVYIFFFYIVDLFMIVELVYDLFLGFVLDVFSYIYLGINMFIFKGGMWLDVSDLLFEFNFWKYLDVSDFLCEMLLWKVYWNFISSILK